MDSSLVPLREGWPGLSSYGCPAFVIDVTSEEERIGNNTFAVDSSVVDLRSFDGWPSNRFPLLLISKESEATDGDVSSDADAALSTMANPSGLSRTQATRRQKLANKTIHMIGQLEGLLHQRTHPRGHSPDRSQDDPLDRQNTMMSQATPDIEFWQNVRQRWEPLVAENLNTMSWGGSSERRGSASHERRDSAMESDSGTVPARTGRSTGDVCYHPQPHGKPLPKDHTAFWREVRLCREEIVAEIEKKNFRGASKLLLSFQHRLEASALSE